MRAGINNHSLALLRALLECGYYSREGLIRGNTVYLKIFSFVWLGLTKVSQAAAGRNLWIDPNRYLRKYPKYH